MSSNKAVRQQLEKIYGKRCMICQGIRKIKPPVPSDKKYRGESIKKQLQRNLTYHHLTPANRYKNRGIKGATTIENGAVLCGKCHQALEELPELEREELNEELREYKRQIDKKHCYIVATTLSTQGVSKPMAVEIEEPTVDYIRIPLIDNYLEQEYLEHKKKRNERVFKKFESLER